MTEIDIKEGKKLLIVEVPDDAIDFDMVIGTEYFFLYYKAHFFEFKKIGMHKLLPPGSWQILGKSSELSEEQMKEIVEKPLHSHIEYMVDPKDKSYTKTIDCYNRPRWTKITSTFYKDYAAKQRPRSMAWIGTVNTVQESYLSLLEANGVVDRGKESEPDSDDYCFAGTNKTDWWGMNEYKKDLNKWQEAQKQVKSYLVLIENNGYGK